MASKLKEEYKSVLEWFEELPQQDKENCKVQYIGQCNRTYIRGSLGHDKMLNHKVSYLYQAINHINWENTFNPTYFKKLYDKAANGEFNSINYIENDGAYEEKI